MTGRDQKNDWQSKKNDWQKNINCLKIFLPPVKNCQSKILKKTGSMCLMEMVDYYLNYKQKAKLDKQKIEKQYVLI